MTSLISTLLGVFDNLFLLFLLDLLESFNIPHDSGNSEAESSEEEPYVPQRKKIADDTLLALFKKEEHRKMEVKHRAKSRSRYEISGS